MSESYWLATPAGRLPAADRRLISDPERVGHRCRCGHILLRLRRWRTDAFVDPLAQCVHDGWRQALQASLADRPGGFVLNVLGGESWHSSDHGSADALLAALQQWIALARFRLPVTYRIPLDGRPPVGEGAARLLANHGWICRLLQAAAVTPFASAAAVFDFASSHVPVREALLAGIAGAAPPARPIVETLDQHRADHEITLLGLPCLYHWLLEAAASRCATVSEPGAPGIPEDEVMIIFPAKKADGSPATTTTIAVSRVVAKDHRYLY